MLLPKLPVFVYGTLRTGQSNWTRLLSGRTISEQPAIAPNHVMYAPSIAFVTDGDGQIVGDLMIIKPRLYQATMRQLDGLEGITNGITGVGHSYCRVRRFITVGENSIEAWLYHGSPSVMYSMQQRNQFLVPDGDWVRHQTMHDAHFTR